MRMITCFVGNGNRKQNENIMVRLLSNECNLIFVPVSQHHSNKESAELLRTHGGDEGTVFTFSIIVKIKK